MGKSETSNKSETSSCSSNDGDNHIKNKKIPRIKSAKLPAFDMDHGKSSKNKQKLVILDENELVHKLKTVKKARNSNGNNGSHRNSNNRQNKVSMLDENE